MYSNNNKQPDANSVVKTWSGGLLADHGWKRIHLGFYTETEAATAVQKCS
jgi:hypothetical protein